jgi:hypothetical protein
MTITMIAPPRRRWSEPGQHARAWPARQPIFAGVALARPRRRYGDWWLCPLDGRAITDKLAMRNRADQGPARRDRPAGQTRWRPVRDGGCGRAGRARGRGRRAADLPLGWPADRRRAAGPDPGCLGGVRGPPAGAAGVRAAAGRAWQASGAGEFSRQERVGLGRRLQAAMDRHLAGWRSWFDRHAGQDAPPDRVDRRWGCGSERGTEPAGPDGGGGRRCRTGPYCLG